MPSLALLHGTDGQALDDSLAAVTRALFPDPTLAALGREVFEARETLPEAVTLAAETLPFGVTMRLVAVRHCQAWLAKDAEPLRAYLKRPAPTTCLLLLADELLAVNRERRADHWLLGAVPAAAIVLLPVRKGRVLQDWLRQRAADEGYTVTADAARLLVDWTGDDPVTLLSETRKAALAAGPNNVEVGAKDVAAIVGENRINDVFHLTRAVEERDLATALTTLERLLDTVEPMVVLSLLARGLRQVCMAHEWSARGQTADQITRMLHVPPFVGRAIVARAQATSSERLARETARCWEVERRLKSSGEPRAELTALVAELCAGA